MSDITDEPLPIDWRDAQREAGSFLSEVQLRTKPHGLPLGKHIMTDELLGYWEASDGSGVELSTGVLPVFGERPRRDVRAIGVTFPLVRRPVLTSRGHDLVWVPDERSRACWSWAQVSVALGYGDGQP